MHNSAIRIRRVIQLISHKTLKQAYYINKFNIIIIAIQTEIKYFVKYFQTKIS